MISQGSTGFSGAQSGSEVGFRRVRTENPSSPGQFYQPTLASIMHL